MFEGTQDSSSSRVSAQEKRPLAMRPSALLDCSFISPLDSYIQERFTQRGRGFGIERIMIPGRGLHTPIPSMYGHPQPKTIGRFVPENDQEKEAVAEIEQSGLKMALYLASRNILGPEPDESQNKDGRMIISIALHAPLRGPVAVTQGSQKTDWPEMSSLWKQARKAMHDFDGDKFASQYEFSGEGKDFIARPVRAQESCLECHNQPAYLSNTPNGAGPTRRLSVGDPIGVLLYAYTNSTKSTIVKNP
ncbi:MAG TPA: hypothetical protein VIC84_03775 [Blastocatellia bacterium]